MPRHALDDVAGFDDALELVNHELGWVHCAHRLESNTTSRPPARTFFADERIVAVVGRVSIAQAACTILEAEELVAVFAMMAGATMNASTTWKRQQFDTCSLVSDPKCPVTRMHASMGDRART